MEILPWGIGESLPAIPGGPGGPTFRIEPLQVCDSGDSFVGVLFDFPVLLTGGPRLLPSCGAIPLALQAAAFVPDGFHPSLDHPPRLRA